MLNFVWHTKGEVPYVCYASSLKGEWCIVTERRMGKNTIQLFHPASVHPVSCSVLSKKALSNIHLSDASNTTITYVYNCFVVYALHVLTDSHVLWDKLLTYAETNIIVPTPQET